MHTSTTKYTLQAVVGDLEVRLQVVRAFHPAFEGGIRHGNIAGTPPGTPRVSQVDDVSGTAHVTVVPLYASAGRHTAILGPLDNDDLILGASSPEYLRLTVRNIYKNKGEVNVGNVKHQIRLKLKFSQYPAIHTNYS